MTTRPLYLNNGADDGRVVQVSSHRGYLSIEQVAVMCGVSTPTARDWFNGRRGIARAAKQIDGAYLVPIEEARNLLDERLQKGLQ